jgi:hypothetical protein
MEKPVKMCLLNSYQNRAVLLGAQVLLSIFLISVSFDFIGGQIDEVSKMPIRKSR